MHHTSVTHAQRRCLHPRKSQLVSKKTNDVIQYHLVKKPCFLSCSSKSIMSRENLHVSEYFANLSEICVLVKKRYYSSFASRSHLFKLLPKSVDRFIAFCKVYKLFCRRQHSFYLNKSVLVPCLSDRCEIVLNGGKITQQRKVIELKFNARLRLAFHSLRKID